MGKFDVWRGVWRCTHAKLAPLTPHPLARDRHYGPASGQRREHMGKYWTRCYGILIISEKLQCNLT